MRLLVLACSSLLAVTSIARADVVDMPPTDCPAGSRGFTCHGGVGCAPVNCMLDTDCAIGEVCGIRSLCVGTLDCYWTGATQVVTGPCESSPCAAGSTCVETRYCLPGTPPPVDAATLADAAGDDDAATPPGPTDGGDGRMLTRGGCACHAGAGGASSGALTVLALVGLAGARRRIRAGTGAALTARRASRRARGSRTPR